MPAERRSLRSNSKSDIPSSANGDRVRRSSQSSSSNKDKAAPARAPANKAKSGASSKKGGSANNSGMGEGEQRQMNGSDAVEKGVNGSEDVEMGEDTAGGPTSSFNTRKEREGDEMTVVVPPSKGSRLSSDKGQDKEGDVAMEGDEPKVDPKVKAIQGKSCAAQLKFDIRQRERKGRLLIDFNSNFKFATNRHQDQLHSPRACCRPF